MEGKTFVPIVLDEDAMAYYQGRAHVAGRTLEAQICYELSVTRGLVAPDPGDEDAAPPAALLRRMRTHAVRWG